MVDVKKCLLGGFVVETLWAAAGELLHLSSKCLLGGFVVET
jgi:hypothetical protein